MGLYRRRSVITYRFGYNELTNTFIVPREGYAPVITYCFEDPDVEIRVSEALLVMQRFADSNKVSPSFLRSLDDICYECALIQKAALKQKQIGFLKFEVGFDFFDYKPK